MAVDQDFPEWVTDLVARNRIGRNEPALNVDGRGAEIKEQAVFLDDDPDELQHEIHAVAEFDRAFLRPGVTALCTHRWWGKRQALECDRACEADAFQLSEREARVCFVLLRT